MAGPDYGSASVIATFSAGSNDAAMQCLTTNITDDTILDGDKTFTVTLTTVDPNVMLGNSLTTVTITDNDEGELNMVGLVEIIMTMYTVYRTSE